MEYKIYKITYNDGDWHSGPLPYFFYIAKNKEEIITNSRKYKEFENWHKHGGGDIWIHEYNGIGSPYDWENLDDFEITISVKEK